MKNKKGFTLIEIIVSLVLIALIATISVVLISKNNKQEYSEITNKIIRAASVYIATEKDGNGNTYEYGITHGAKGAQISVKTLYDKGYIDESTLKTLETNYKIEKDKTYLIQVTNSIKGKDAAECKSSVLNYTVNWENTTDTVYLCPYDENKVTETASFYDLQKCPNDNNATNKFCYYSDDKKYYYVDKVDNNYVSFGKDSETKALWRILYIDKENNEVKLVYDKRINGGKKNPNSKTISYSNFTFPSDYEQDFGIYIAYHYANAVTSQIDDENGHNNNNQIRANKDCTYHYDTNSQSIETICDGCHNHMGESDRWYHYTNIRSDSRCENDTTKSSSRPDESAKCTSDKVEKNGEIINVNCPRFTYYASRWYQGAKFQFYNPIYVYYYEPLHELIDEILGNEEKAKLKNHKFVVNEEKGIFYEDIIGVPTVHEYGIITTEHYPDPRYSDVNPYAYFYGNDTDKKYKIFVNKDWTPELTMNFASNDGSIKITPIVNVSPSKDFSEVYLRPVIVLDLKNLNLSNGDGTKENPYTIE